MPSITVKDLLTHDSRRFNDTINNEVLRTAGLSRECDVQVCVASQIMIKYKLLLVLLLLSHPRNSQVSDSRFITYAPN